MEQPGAVTDEKQDEPRHVRLRTGDVDEARAFCDKLYDYPLRSRPVGRVEDFSFAGAAVKMGPLTVADVRYGADMRLDTADLETAYHVLVPVEGGMRSRQGDSVVTATSRRAAVFGPVGPIELAWPAACRLLSVKVERSTLETELAAVHGGNPTVPPGSIDLASGPGRGWAALLGLLREELAEPGGLVRQPLMAHRWRHLVVGGLAVALDRRDLGEPHPPMPTLRPRTVKRALDAMHAEPAYPFTAADLAVAAGVGVRVLQESFRRYVGMPPLVYLRQLRLEKAHEELRLADPRETGVGEVAHRWGFAHLGRFAGAYRQRYGVSPSRTLHSPP
ncbi:AraC family transcriptional regulator [Spirilliplanes yamanashiensis]|uniref:AraC family transcriptional regulator n=1 Tax=Spirilliplanes yamanashiensis TaxID=42233 RepID=A0A8J3YA31_9ACTN|nr:AraC family transcriptional regulator [Spirilliplanes yamanashiensis]MDP9817977.1 AraC-like DNA-binding protein [Spirilliplanes yamanashiensis]GIJ04786.1 AraC family transcriptional regulator [Spirilliplanes yamanashiensis]